MKPRGIACPWPDCHSLDNKVRYTRDVKDHNLRIRKRLCLRCMREFTTEESIRDMDD